MTNFRDIEATPQESRPQEFFHFYRGTEDWYYTSGHTPVPDTVITRDTITGPYVSMPVTRGTVEEGGDDAPGAISLRLPLSSGVAQAVIHGKNDIPVSLEILVWQKAATYDPQIIFLGEVVDFDEQGDVVELKCEPPLAQGEIPIPKLLFQKDRCAWNTYTPDCGVAIGDFSFTANVTVIDNEVEITIPGAEAFGTVAGEIDPDFFSGGFLKKGNKRALIEIQSGDTVVLQEPMDGLAVGDSVTIVAGDDRTIETCHFKFNNSLRRLSYPSAPEQNPWYGQGLRETS